MVRGVLKFEDPGLVPSGQRVLIMVQDTSHADASSVAVAQTEVTIPEDFDAEKDGLPFEIEVQEKTDGLSIRAHMPRHDDTDVRLGDMITMASIPVKKEVEEVDVTLRRVV